MELERLLDNLKGVERYFGFPGHNCIDNITEALKRNEYIALAIVSQITRKLVSDSYRGHPT